MPRPDHDNLVTWPDFSADHLEIALGPSTRIIHIEKTQQALFKRAFCQVFQIRLFLTSILPSLARNKIHATHLQCLQLSYSLLHQLLYPSRVGLLGMFTESVDGTTVGVLAEVVSCKLLALTEQGAVL